MCDREKFFPSPFTWKAFGFLAEKRMSRVRMRQPERKKSRAVESSDSHENVCHRDASRTAWKHNNILRNTKTCSVRQKERRMKEKGKIENASVDETEVFGSNWILANYGCSKDILRSFSSVHCKPPLLKPRERRSSVLIDSFIYPST